MPLQVFLITIAVYMQWVPCCVICCIVLTTGADTEVQGQYGMTPLMHACFHGHKEVASHLIEHGEQLQIFVGMPC